MEDLLLKRSAGFMRRYNRMKDKFASCNFPVLCTWAASLLADHYAQSGNFEEAYAILKDR